MKWTDADKVRIRVNYRHLNGVVLRDEEMKSLSKKELLYYRDYVEPWYKDSVTWKNFFGAAMGIIAGTLIPIAVITGVIWFIASISSSASQAMPKDEYIDVVDGAIDEMDARITEIYDSGKRAYDAVAGECASQAKNLSRNIGVYCHENAKLPWADYIGPYSDVKDYLVSDKYDDIDFATQTYEEDASSSELEAGVQEIVEYGNTKVEVLLGYIRDMLQSTESQCDWVDENIGGDAAEDCYSIVSDFDMSDTDSQPFETTYYISFSDSTTD